VEVLEMKPYQPGQNVAGVQIVRVAKLAGSKQNTIYAVRYQCCGVEGELTHQRIDRRRGSNSRLCNRCGKFGRAVKSPEDRYKLEIPPPAWPVPNTK
jgi:hypothetical protein